jgi:hypothetical protein
VRISNSEQARSSEDGQLDLVGTLAVHGQRAVDEAPPRAVHALVHLEQLRVAVRVPVALQVGREPGPLGDGVADAAHGVRLGVGRHDARVGEDGREVVPRLERQRGLEVLVLVQVGAGAVLLPLVAPELEAAPVFARQRAPVLVQGPHEVADLPGMQRVAVVAVLRPAPAAALEPEDGEEGGTGEAALAGGVVGPQAVDAKVRRRPHVAREAAALTRVAERTGPLHDEGPYVYIGEMRSRCYILCVFDRRPRIVQYVKPLREHMYCVRTLPVEQSRRNRTSPPWPRRQGEKAAAPWRARASPSIAAGLAWRS